MHEVQNKVVLISGVSGALGSQICEHFLEKNYIVIGLSRSSHKLKHENYSHKICDIRKNEDIVGVIADIKSTYGRVDILINAAGVITSQHSMLLPYSSITSMVETNILGTMFLSIEVSKIMMRRKFGRMIFFGSMASILKPVGDSVYSVTKHATITIAQNLAIELAAFGITCNSIVITSIDDGMAENINEGKLREIIQNLPISRSATITDVTHTLDYLVDKRSDYITGQTIAFGGLF